jgi:septum site-determining protein MinC
MSATQTISPPGIVVRGRSFLALTLAPEWPLRAWLAALDAQRLRAVSLFEGRPLVVNLAGAPGGPAAPEAALEAALEALDALALRDLRVIGVDGVDADLLNGTRWGRLPTVLLGREGGHDLLRDAAAPAADSKPSAAIAAPAAAAPSLLIDRPVRSGQSVVFEDGDVTVIGPVASGAEVIAGGSIHVYGALRGRAIAGLSAGPSAGGSARIFCRKLEAELVAVEGHYRTAEHWGDGLHGQAVQIRNEGRRLRLTPLD